MKRKVKKYSGEDGSLVEKEGKGFFGETQKWKEDKEGRKFTDSGNRYYSADDVKSKLSGLFGGKKEESTPKAEGTNRFTAAKDNTPDPEKGIAADFKSSEPKFERNDNEKSMPDVKKAAPRKAPPKQEKDAEYVRKAANDALKEAAPEPKKAKVEKDEKPTPLPAKAEDKKPVGKDATPMKKEEPAKKGFSFYMSNKPEEQAAQAKANRDAIADVVKNIKLRNPFEDKPVKKPFERKLNTKPTADQMKKMARGGSVKSSASSRGDGCAVRGKTKGRIY